MDIHEQDNNDHLDEDRAESAEKPIDEEQYTLSSELYDAGRELFDRGSFEDALTPLKRSWDVLNDSKTAEIMARCHVELEDFAPALYWFNKSVELNPRRQPIYRFRAELYEKIGNLGSALRDYEKAVQIAPDYKRCRLAAERIRKELRRRGGVERP